MRAVVWGRVGSPPAAEHGQRQSLPAGLPLPPGGGRGEGARNNAPSTPTPPPQPSPGGGGRDGSAAMHATGADQKRLQGLLDTLLGVKGHRVEGTVLLKGEGVLGIAQVVLCLHDPPP